AHVRDLGVLAHVEAAVDAAAQVLGEVAVEVAADGGAGQVQIDDHASGAVGATAARSGRAGGAGGGDGGAEGGGEDGGERARGGGGAGAGDGGAERGGQAGGERAGGIGHEFSPGRRWLSVGSVGKVRPRCAGPGSIRAWARSPGSPRRSTGWLSRWSAPPP